jgi:hypothetical protein
LFFLAHLREQRTQRDSHCITREKRRKQRAHVLFGGVFECLMNSVVVLGFLESELIKGEGGTTSLAGRR